MDSTQDKKVVAVLVSEKLANWQPTQNIGKYLAAIAYPEPFDYFHPKN